MLSVFIEFFDSYIKIFEIYSVVDQFELGSYCCSWLNSSFRVCCNNIQLKLGEPYISKSTRDEIYPNEFCEVFLSAVGIPMRLRWAEIQK